MQTNQIIKFFEAATDYKLTILDQSLLPALTIEPGETYKLEVTGPFGYTQRIDWKVPSNEDSSPRSLITCFCSKYRKMNPTMVPGNPSAEKCEENATRWHSGFCYSKEQMREQLTERFHGMPFSQKFYGLLCPTLYGIGVWVVFGAREDLIEKIASALSDAGVKYSNEWSRAHWVYRFKTGLDKNENCAFIDSLAK